VDNKQFRIGADGELEEAVLVGWDEKRKKRLSQGQRIYRLVRFFIITLAAVALTVAFTMVSSGVIDLSQYQWYRGLCLSGFGSTRLIFAELKPNGTWLRTVDPKTGKSCGLSYSIRYDGITYRPGSNQITYHAYPNMELRVINMDGSNERTIAAGTNGLWSPDGTHLLYSFRQPTFNTSLYIMKADGSDVRELYSDVADYTWSPDSQTIAFEASTLAIKLVNSDGSNKRDLIKGGKPLWSPDGQDIAFLTWDGRRYFLSVIKPDGSDFRQLTTIPTRNEAGFAWSPDSKHIAFVADVLDKGDRTGIHIVDVESGTSEAIADEEIGNGTYYFVAWSPDGKQLAFNKMVGQRSTIYIANADGTEKRSVYENGQMMRRLLWVP
jgi:Tol biopolymer transport system component